MQTPIEQKRKILYDWIDIIDEDTLDGLIEEYT
jgi:hypothetical protein